MATGLLERSGELALLSESLAAAEEGRGSALLIYGEAGVGKTSLLSSFEESIGGRARVLAGACDDLLTPRTLGPFKDMARVVGGALADALGDGSDRDAIFAAVLEELSGFPTVVIIEDVHWADDATLDVLRFLAARSSSMTGVLLLTFRDEELGGEHPLRRVLGAFSGPGVRRIPLRRLSRRAVAELCRAAGIDFQVVFDATGGNPFFVTEVIASPDADVPATIRDAVLARVRELSDESQRALELLAVIPGRVERDLAESLLGGASHTLDDAERRGVLAADTEALWFRHELARRAVEQSMSATTRVEHNRLVLEKLLEQGGVELSRVAHHALEANDAEAVVRYGLAAAREAATAGSLHEAHAHYSRVVSLPERFSQAEFAALVEESAWVIYSLHRFEDAHARAQEAVEMWEALGDERSLGAALIGLSRFSYMVNDPAGSLNAAQRAVALLEPFGETPELAQAYSYLGAILKLTDRLEEAMEHSKHAISLAERTDRRDVVAHSLNYLGCALMDLGDASGARLLYRSAEIARSIHEHEYVVRAHTNLVEGLFRLGLYDEAVTPIEEGLAYARDHETPAHHYNLEAHRCMLLTLRGRWEEAERSLRELLELDDQSVLAVFVFSALGRLLARRASDEATGLLDRAWEVATTTGSVQAIALAGIARVEAEWLRGDAGAALDAAKLPLERTHGRGGERYRAELLRYLERAGHPAPVFERCPEEFALGLAGDWGGAAEAWARIGAPYERALELGDSGRPAEMLEALTTLEELGANAAGDLIRRRLRTMGVKGLPRRPQPGTKQHPAGLTDRQVEVLVLLADGLTNAEIAERLVVSIRTVDHHVSAILTKLQVATRRDAGRAAQRLGLASTPAQS
ncbi:MAG: ATP-binding protein [Actinomycetota bacterium]